MADRRAALQRAEEVYRRAAAADEPAGAPAPKGCVIWNHAGRVPNALGGLDAATAALSVAGLPRRPALGRRQA